MLDDDLFREREHALSPAMLAAMRTAIATSPHLAHNQLGPRFADSRGFSIIFKRATISYLRRDFPAFDAYLAQALLDTANGFYLNALVLEQGASVGPHADTSLSTPKTGRLHPVVVSVLYLSVPDDLRGGRLTLRDGRRKVAELPPQENTLLWFRGDLVHAVGRVRTRAARISLVCEQYALTDDQLAGLPDYAIESTDAS